MNKIMKYGFLALSVLVMMSSCMDKNARKNNYPAPNIALPPVGTVYTISDLVHMISISGDPNYVNDTIFKNDCSIYGIITDDETSGNIYKASFIQERATGKAIELYMKSVTGLRIGDSVRVCLKGSVLGAYKGTPQIQNLESVKVVVLDNQKYIEPEVVTISQLQNQNMLCQLVKLENVQFVADEMGKNWADENGYGERYLEEFVETSPGQWAPTGSTIMVRTSNYAAFANKPLPTGNGSLVAIVTLYNNTWQLVVRDNSEAIMDGERH